MSENHLEHWLADMAAEQGGRALTRNGCLSIELNGVTVNVEYQPEQERLYLYAGLAPLEEHAGAERYETLLRANFLGLDTAGGHLGLHGATRILTYSQELDPRTLDERLLRNALALFAAKTAELTTLLRQEQSGPEAGAYFSGPLLGTVLWG